MSVLIGGLILLLVLRVFIIPILVLILISFVVSLLHLSYNASIVSIFVLWGLWVIYSIIGSDK